MFIALSAAMSLEDSWVIYGLRGIPICSIPNANVPTTHLDLIRLLTQSIFRFGVLQLRICVFDVLQSGLITSRV
jgi:hypothetical protein